MRNERGEREHEVEVWIGDVCWQAIVEVEGRYRAATWGYSGGSPAEGPEASIVKAWRLTSDPETGETIEASIAPSLVEDDAARALEERALEVDEDWRESRDAQDGGY
jgi:hypothetical protein